MRQNDNENLDKWDIILSLTVVISLIIAMAVGGILLLTN